MGSYSPTKVMPAPLFWKQEKAYSFPDIWQKICNAHPPNHTVPREVIACIFFEETAFCNRKQQGGPAVGFGQMQIFDYDKRDFFSSVMKVNTNKNDKESEQPLLSYDQVVADADLAVQITCKYFQYLVSQRAMSLQGAMRAQTGGVSGGGVNNASFGDLFIQGGQMLKEAMSSSDSRKQHIAALNFARSNGPHKNGISEKLFTKFWDFVLPQDYIQTPSMYLAA